MDFENSIDDLKLHHRQTYRLDTANSRINLSNVSKHMLHIPTRSLDARELQASIFVRLYRPIINLSLRYADG